MLWINIERVSEPEMHRFSHFLNKTKAPDSVEESLSLLPSGSYKTQISLVFLDKFVVKPAGGAYVIFLGSVQILIMFKSQENMPTEIVQCIHAPHWQFHHLHFLAHERTWKKHLTSLMSFSPFIMHRCNNNTDHAVFPTDWLCNHGGDCHEQHVLQSHPKNTPTEFRPCFSFNITLHY